VEQGDFTLTSDSLVGHYDEKNQIQDLVATGNVIIIRGDSVRATGERAEYLQATETITLTESPELQQDDSVLTADTIKIFLNEDRSTAEGNVRVKLVEDKEKKQGKKKSSGSFSLKKR
jgi:lipopolysaccharide transport protein LptA